MIIVGIFDLGNSSDAFLVLRAQERGMSTLSILIMLAVFNLVYTLVSTPAGMISDKIGRKKLIIGGWTMYALIYLGFALARNVTHIWLLYVAYGLYYGMAYGTAKAMLSDLVPKDLRGTAFGTYNAVLEYLISQPPDRGFALERCWKLERLWSFRAFLLWRYPCNDCYCADVVLEAKNYDWNSLTVNHKVG